MDLAVKQAIDAECDAILVANPGIDVEQLARYRRIFRRMNLHTTETRLINRPSFEVRDLLVNRLRRRQAQAFARVDAQAAIRKKMPRYMRFGFPPRELFAVHLGSIYLRLEQEKRAIIRQAEELAA